MSNLSTLFYGKALSACCTAVGLAFLVPCAQAQGHECDAKPDAPQCQIPKIANGALVPTDVQRLLGLVTVNGGCSGTLISRYWVLTARHCVTSTGQIAGPLAAPGQLNITATWAPGSTVVPSRLREFTVNQGGTPTSDIILVYLGMGDFGAAKRQLPYITNRTSLFWTGRRLQTTDTVNQYGRGFSTFASGIFGTPSAVPAAGLGIYRTASFSPSNISQTNYRLTMNGSNQVGHGGDSGGPTYITRDGISFFGGVQSTCSPVGYIRGAPAQWIWATGINFCTYVSVEPLVEEIRRATKETPECKLGPACAMPAVLDYLLP